MVIHTSREKSGVALCGFIMVFMKNTASVKTDKNTQIVPSEFFLCNNFNCFIILLIVKKKNSNTSQTFTLNECMKRLKGVKAYPEN